MISQSTLTFNGVCVTQSPYTGVAPITYSAIWLTYVTMQRNEGCRAKSRSVETLSYVYCRVAHSAELVIWAWWSWWWWWRPQIKPYLLFCSSHGDVFLAVTSARCRQRALTDATQSCARTISARRPNSRVERILHGGALPLLRQFT